MWSIRRKNDLISGRYNIISSIFFAAILLLTLAVFTGIESGYTPITKKCIMCHNDTTYPEDTDSDGYTAPYKRPHNNTVMCESCHTVGLHNVKYIQPDGTFGPKETAAKCPDCHQAYINNSNFTTARIIPIVLKHSSDISNGSIWGSYWTSAADACIYCHGDTKHNINGLGKIRQSLLDANNTRNAILTDTAWCANCHYNDSNQNYIGTLNISGGPTYVLITGGASYTFNPVPPLITVNNSNTSGWVNHSSYVAGGYKDINCTACHSLIGNYEPTSLNYSHSLNAGVGGGPDCIYCHYNGSTYHNIDIDSANKSAHSGMNSENATKAGIAALNGACWGCHDSDGNISNNDVDEVMGNIYNTPKKCDDCHLLSGSYYSQAISWGGLTVTQHFYSGSEIAAGNSSSDISSCITCHENVMEMIFPNNDTDIGTFPGDGVRLTGGNMSFYHYGKRRADLRIVISGSNISDCPYCHQNVSTAFTSAMQRPDISKNIFNHTDNQPDRCNDCHGAGWIHNSTLGKPSLNNDLCLSCHVSGFNLTRRINETHNSTSMNCWNCHQDPDGMMSGAPAHGIMYPQENGSYMRYDRGTPANCITCHVNNLLNISTNIATKVPGLNHSSDPYSGKKWGNYWDNNSMITACYYCHQTDIHSFTFSLLGNVSRIKGSNRHKSQDLSTSRWCSNCHYNDSSYMGDILILQPPEITNSSLSASDGTPFFNHTGFSDYNDSICMNCHFGALSGYVESTINFSHSVSEGGGGPDCILCHDTNGIGAPFDKRIDSYLMKKGVHRDLNTNAQTPPAINDLSKACWACHGDGSAPSGHPRRYKTPRNCQNDECHSLAQSGFYEPMIYSHFRNSSLNDNPANATNYNITTSAECPSCHINSVVKKDSDTVPALVSHYGSRDNLVDSFNCRYCHLDRANSEDWGNATLINKEQTSLIELDKEGKQITVSEGEKFYLGEGYFLKLLEVSGKRDSALIQLIREDRIEDETLVDAGIPYQYKKEITIDNSTFKTPVIILNITSVVKGEKRGFIQFDGFRIRKIHTERENRNNSACFACHVYRYSGEKQRYEVIDREYDENPSKDIIYYVQVLLDLKPGNKSKIYFNNENDIFNQNISGKFIPYSSPQKFLREGEIWSIAQNYSLELSGVSSSGKEAILTLNINDFLEQRLIKTGTEINYTPGLRYKEFWNTNFTVLTANVSSIGNGSTNFVILKDVVAKSPAVMKTTADTRLLGYNASWFKPGDQFMTGRIPENLHSPNIYTDQRGWSDCVKCHDSSKNLMISDIDAVSSRLGKHSKLNAEASNKNILNDPINKACWACHTEGKEPDSHSPTYITARACKSCHAYQEGQFYGAIDISGEPHSSETGCETCHIIGSHNLVRFQVTPVIQEAIISHTTVGRGDIIDLVIKAKAGYKMKIRATEYFIDNKSYSGKGSPLLPVDGVFDSQNEEMIAHINTTGLSAGEHVIYVHAMERNNSWGEYYSLTFQVLGNYGISGRLNESVPITTEKIKKFLESGIYSIGWNIILLITGSIAVYILIAYRR